MFRTPAMQRLQRLLVQADRLNGGSEQSGLSRRRLLTGAGALAAGSAFPAAALAWRRPSVAIVGAGLAGLNAALTLQSRGLEAQVFEAAGRVGGRVSTLENAFGRGLTLELGGEFINTDHADMIGLARRFGLQLFSRQSDFRSAGAPETAYFVGGSLLPEQVLAELLRPIARQIRRDARLIEQNFDVNAPAIDALNVTQYLNAFEQSNGKLDSRIRYLLEATCRTEYGVEPEQSSALQLLANLPSVDGQTATLLGNSDEALTVIGGNERIPQSMAAALKRPVSLGKKLTRLTELPTGGFRLSFQDGGVCDADYVLIALPPPALRSVRLDVNLRPALRRFLAGVQIGRNEKLIAHFAGRPWRSQGLFAGEIWGDFGFSEAWDASQRQVSQGSDGALTFFLGGQEALNPRPRPDTIGSSPVSTRLRLGWREPPAVKCAVPSGRRTPSSAVDIRPSLQAS